MFVGDIYLDRIFDYNIKISQTETIKVSIDDKQLPRIILLVISFFISLGLTLYFYGTKRLYQFFSSSLKRYHSLLFNFSETPRSKVAKKYIPPMEPL